MMEMIKKSEGVFEYRGYDILLATTGYVLYDNDVCKSYLIAVANLEEAKKYIDGFYVNKNSEEKKMTFTGVSFGYGTKEVHNDFKVVVSDEIGLGKQTVSDNVSSWTYDTKKWECVDFGCYSTPMPVSDWETRFSTVGFGDLSIDVKNSGIILENKIEEVEKLNPKPGEILLVRVSNSEDGLYDKMRKSLDNMGYKDVQLIITNMNYKLSQLDEKEMEEHGWVKKHDSRREFF